MKLQLHDRVLDLDRPLIMGILNITPDSFSDGGRYLNPEPALAHAEELITAGADIIDVGGESTRPGAISVGATEEWERLRPVISRLREHPDIVISVDTYKSTVAERALDAGAHLINDISAMTVEPQIASVVAAAKAPLVIMHMKGTPRNMQKAPHYDDVYAEIHAFFEERIKFAKNQGVSQLLLDPGIGFGKRMQDNLELIRRLGEFKDLGYPLILGTSRKSFLQKIANSDSNDTLPGTLASNLIGVRNGANILRVHDVKEMKQALDVYKAIEPDLPMTDNL